jgi:ketosteroid isomerase-like protein
MGNSVTRPAHFVPRRLLTEPNLIYVPGPDFHRTIDEGTSLRRFIGFATAFLWLASGSVPAAAQMLPIQREDPRAADRAYQAEVLREAQATITDWHQAWARRDARALMRLYTSDALLIVPDASVAPLHGAEAIQAHLEENWAATGNIRFGLAAAEASGRLLYLSGRFFVDGVQAAQRSGASTATTQPQSGTFVAVMQRQGRGWRIRAQIFRPDGAVGE